MVFKKGHKIWAGRKLSEEHKRKVGLAHKGKKVSKETRKKISEANKKRFKRMTHPMLGKKHSVKSRKKMSQSLKGRISPRKGVKVSEEVKKKMSESKKRLFASNEDLRKRMSIAQKKKYAEGATPWNKGKPASEESKKRMSIAQKKKYAEGATPWNKGKPASEESKKRMSIAQKKKYAMGFTGRKGTKHSEVSKQKMSKSVRKAYADGFEVWNKGKPMRESTRQKLIARYTPELREQKRKWRAGKVFPNRDTKIEKILQNLLRDNKIKFETPKEYVKRGIRVLGQPDILIQPNVCIFADGDFWHGWKYMQGARYDDAKNLNNEYFKRKIKSDKENTKNLIKQGYTVLRFWEHELLQESEKCFKRILKKIQK